MEHHINIPRLDLKQYTEGDATQRAAFSAALGSAFTDTGFATIANHDMDEELIDTLYEVIRQFFSLPESEKRRYEVPGLAGQRGYTSKGKETAKGSKAADLKEFWQRGQTVIDGDPVANTYPDNLSVDIPGFDAITAEVFTKLEAMGKTLLKAIAVYLGLQEAYFETSVHNGNSILRAIHYFPIENPEMLPKDAVRAGAHEDINLITLLVGASADGLEVLTRDRVWIPVKAQAADIVINVGDMLQRITNNKLRSTTHRVVNPPTELMKTSRYSVPFFLHPKANMSLAVLEHCIDQDHPKAYPDYTAGEYLDERLREIGLK